MTTSTALRIARYAEGIYAVVAIVLAFGIQFPPRGPAIVLFVHWIGTALLAGAICLRLGRPNRQVWYVAALLSAYVLFNAMVAIARLVGPDTATLGRPGLLALAVGALLLVTQIVVATCLYEARELRTMASSPSARRR
ncbi:MAG TPA: HD domain-containing protein [Gemmatimonadaceae bacterium]|nr:HD domain-containing protein [Gemmatimonadaceae bacterium]